jgi:hypothetical protein
VSGPAGVFELVAVIARLCCQFLHPTIHPRLHTR